MVMITSAGQRFPARTSLKPESRWGAVPALRGSCDRENAINPSQPCLWWSHLDRPLAWYDTQHTRLENPVLARQLPSYPVNPEPLYGRAPTSCVVDACLFV